MGMFDWVNVKIPCPKCGTSLSNFQSKDYTRTGSIIEPELVDTFYDSCEKCGTWVQYTRYPTHNVIPRNQPATLQEITALGFKPGTGEDA